MLALVILVPLLVACAGSDSLSASDVALIGSISNELMCKCGCGEVLSTCECSDAEEMKTLIEQRLAQGQSKEQILQLFVDQYGKQVLAESTNP